MRTHTKAHVHTFTHSRNRKKEKLRIREGINNKNINKHTLFYQSCWMHATEMGEKKRDIFHLQVVNVLFAFAAVALLWMFLFAFLSFNATIFSVLNEQGNFDIQTQHTTNTHSHTHAETQRIASIQSHLL